MASQPSQIPLGAASTTRQTTWQQQQPYLQQQQPYLQQQRPIVQQQQPFLQQQQQPLQQQQQTFQQQTFVQQQASVEKIAKPAVVYETVHKEELEEIQPVIHREHDRTEVHQITQPIMEGVFQSTVIQEKELAAEFRAPVQLGSLYISPATPQGSCTVQEFHKIVEKSPIIMETERKKVIEEIQPVVYKDVLQPTLIRETRQIYERIVEAPVIIQETRATQYVGASLQAKNKEKFCKPPLVLWRGSSVQFKTLTFGLLTLPKTQ